jgi:hypothetical protein
MSHLDYSSDVPSSAQDQFVRLGQFRDLTEALVVKGMLESSGIQYFLGDENTVRMDWFWSNAVGGVKLWVRQSDAESARALTQETREEAEAENRSTPRPRTRQKYALRSAIAGFVVSALVLSCSYFFYTRINRKLPDGLLAVFSILCPSSLEETILEQGKLGPAGANWFFICLQNALLYGLVGFSIGKTVQATQGASGGA